MNPSMVSAYTMAHAVILVTATFAFFDIMGVFDLGSIGMARWRFDVLAICEDIDGSFGADEKWMEQCASGLKVVKLIAGLMGAVFLGAEWWGLASMCAWGRELRFQKRLRMMKSMDVSDLEKAGNMDAKVTVSGNDT